MLQGFERAVLVSALTVSSALAQDLLPIPQDAETVILARPSLIDQDPQLRPLLKDFVGIDYYLGLLKLEMDQVNAAMITLPQPVGPNADSSNGIGQHLTEMGTFMISGDFDLKSEYRALKKRGWREKEYTGKKVLWWSESHSYVVSPKIGECAAILPDDRFLVAGSKDALIAVFDIIDGTRPALTPKVIYRDLASSFDQDTLIILAAYSTAGEEMKQTIKSAIASTQIPAMEKVLEYVDRIQELGFSLSGRGEPYLVNASFAMDSENSAILVSNVLQIAGGLVGLFPDERPIYKILSTLNTSRDERVVRIRAHLSRAEIDEFLERRQ